MVACTRIPFKLERQRRQRDVEGKYKSKLKREKKRLPRRKKPRSYLTPHTCFGASLSRFLFEFAPLACAFREFQFLLLKAFTDVEYRPLHNVILFKFWRFHFFVRSIFFLIGIFPSLSLSIFLEKRLKCRCKIKKISITTLL